MHWLTATSAALAASSSEESEELVTGPRAPAAATSAIRLSLERMSLALSIWASLSSLICAAGAREEVWFGRRSRRSLALHARGMQARPRLPRR